MPVTRQTLRQLLTAVSVGLILTACGDDPAGAPAQSPTLSRPSVATSTTTNAELATWRQKATQPDACSTHALFHAANITFVGSAAATYCKRAQDGPDHLEADAGVDPGADAVVCTASLPGAEAAVTDGGEHKKGAALCTDLKANALFAVAPVAPTSSPGVASLASTPYSQVVTADNHALLTSTSQAASSACGAGDPAGCRAAAVQIRAAAQHFLDDLSGVSVPTGLTHVDGLLRQALADYVDGASGMIAGIDAQDGNVLAQGNRQAEAGVSLMNQATSELAAAAK